MRFLLILVLLAAGAAIALKMAQSRPAGGSRATEQTDSRGLGSDVAESLSDVSEAERQAALRRIAAGDTYLPIMLAESDSALRRWVDRESRPLLLYYGPGDGVPGYRTEMGRAVRDAFARWGRVAVIPVNFRVVGDPDQAEVVVRWIDSFDVRRSGQADLVWSSDGKLQRGTLTLATRTQSGQTLTFDEIFTVALHEIGHLLGLGHSDREQDVMFTTTSVHDLTIRDRRTATLLYSLPPGSYGSPSTQ